MLKPLAKCDDPKAYDDPPRRQINGSGERTLRLNRMSKRTLEQLRQEHDGHEDIDYDRPKTRSDCCEGARPCPFVSCKYNLYLDVSPMTGNVLLNHGARELEDMPATCALDVADAHREGLTLEEVGDILGVTRERVRQIQDKAFRKLVHGGALALVWALSNEPDVATRRVRELAEIEEEPS